MKKPLVLTLLVTLSLVLFSCNNVSQNSYSGGDITDYKCEAVSSEMIIRAENRLSDGIAYTNKQSDNNHSLVLAKNKENSDNSFTVMVTISGENSNTTSTLKFDGQKLASYSSADGEWRYEFSNGNLIKRYGHHSSEAQDTLLTYEENDDQASAYFQELTFYNRYFIGQIKNVSEYSPDSGNKYTTYMTADNDTNEGKYFSKLEDALAYCQGGRNREIQTKNVFEFVGSYCKTISVFLGKDNNFTESPGIVLNFNNYHQTSIPVIPTT